MATTVQEVYQNTILPLSEEERLRIAALIINDISDRTSRNHERNGSSERVSEMFGSVSLGYATGADNEAIDADLAHDYSDKHKD